MYDICMCIRVYNCEIASMSQVMWYLNMFCISIHMYQQVYNIPPTFLNTWVKELQRRLKVWITTYRGIDFHTTRECDVYIPRDCTCISPEYTERHVCNDNPLLPLLQMKNPILVTHTQTHVHEKNKNKTTNLNATSAWTRLTITYLNYHLIFGTNIRIS